MGMAGKMVHLEIGAADADRATAFYREVFGWQFGDSGMPGIDYRMARLDEQSGAAVFPSEDAGKGPLVYIDTDDIDASIGKVRDSGGKSDDKQPIPGVGWFSHATDTEGNRIGLFQSDESVAPPQ
jgi:predicted enzyme related to lactoylglutathione lyase